MAVSSLLCATAFHPASAQAQQRGASPAPGAASQPQSTLPAPSEALLTEIEGIYKDIHANPELSMQERRTAGIAAEWLRKQGYEVAEGVGGVGVVGVLRNGDGATVLLRADMDALPMQENTGLPYASSKTGIDPANGQETAIAHSCGHDMHVAWLMATAHILSENRDKWRGTVVALFQPGEETAEGAKAMVEDGLVRRFPKPDVVLGQHVMPLAAGQVAISSGTILSRSDSLEVMLFGRGGHGSSPETTVDPVVMAASAVTQLQTVVSREIGMTDQAVITVGALQAGSSANIIPERALLRLNIRTFDDQVRERVLASVRRIITQQAELSRSPKPPTFKTLSTFPLTINDEDATRKVAEALRERMGADRVQPASAASASEDFTVLARAWDVPSVYWLVGGTDPDTYAKAQKEGRPNDIPSNHSPEFAPVLQPTLRAGIEAMLAAASPWLVSGQAHR
ncbi:amidohydrolase [Teichococcus oryzae]|uniref:amidohydrolase n=1 Tax=Teichococcus oryzae TaxID=1608942 RepID=UPI0019D5A590|nr:amidohydrolase [Pseudoroseomonas oryzae]